MPFWNLASSEPKRQHRFTVSFSSLLTTDGKAYEEYLAKTATIPGYTVSTTTHRFLGNEYYYPGTVTWDEVTVQIVIGEWRLKNAFITSAKFGNLDYAGDEILNVDIGLRYDWATYVSSPPLGSA